eukprot:CAMPEP_0171199434 /NCGR_PEP_ID=MMETSP0790-20130122/23462_1 /TAXON_ID=2925 /ORGANISM="Alexandrium catenella, Strain OF101" /LENGTH=135 /DNA_ID=CAMNT_0011664781 /DNA_START=89 /DNA_END=496 /DNA_ORIENTATION=+
MGKKASRTQLDASRMPATTSIPSKAQAAASDLGGVVPNDTAIEATPAEKFQEGREKKKEAAAEAKEEQRKAAEPRAHLCGGRPAENKQKEAAATKGEQLLLKKLTGGFRVSQDGIAARNRADRYEFHEKGLSKYL